MTAIVIAPNSSSALNSAIDRARKAGIKVITVDSRVTTPSEGFIGTDNVKAGMQAGQAHVRAAQGAEQDERQGADRVVRGRHPVTGRPRRRLPAGPGAKNCPKVEASLQRYNNNDINTAASQVNDALTANRDLVGVFADNNTSGVGAARAIKDNNAADTVSRSWRSTPTRRRTPPWPPAPSTRWWCRTPTSSVTRASWRPRMAASRPDPAA